MPVFFLHQVVPMFSHHPAGEEGGGGGGGGGGQHVLEVELDESCCMDTTFNFTGLCTDKSCIGKRFAETRPSSRLTLEYPNPNITPI